MQEPLTPAESVKHLVVPRGLSRRAVRRRAGPGRQADRDELGRARAAVGGRNVRLSQRVAAAGRGARSHSHLRGHRRRRPGRQVHRLRRAAEHSDEPHVFARRRDRASTARRPSSSRTPTATTWPTSDACCLAPGTSATRTAARATCSTAWTTGSGPCRATTTRGSKWMAVDASLPPGLFPLPARRLRAGIHPLDEQQHLGTRHQRRGARVRLDGQPQSQRLHADRQPLLRRGARLDAVAGVGHDRRHAPVPTDHRQGPAGRSPRRLHGRRRARAVHGPALPAGVLEPHGVRLRTDGAPGRHVRAAPEGSGFRSTSPFNLLASDDEWTAPIMAEVGPDGNVWVIDWYNYIVQHNPTPRGFETGRGKRLRNRAARQEPWPDLSRRLRRPCPTASRCRWPDASPQELVETLTHSNLFWRRHAQRLLVERGKRGRAAGADRPWPGDRSVDAIGLNVGAIHALWTLHGLARFDGSRPEATASGTRSLKHPSAGVRRNAIQVLPAEEHVARGDLSTPVCSTTPIRRSGWRRCWPWPTLRRVATSCGGW